MDSDLSFFSQFLLGGYQDQVNSLFDVAAWCGCDGDNLNYLWSFCDDDEPMVNPDIEIAGSRGLTCATAANLSRFVADPTIYSVDFAALSRGCRQSEDRCCSICPDGSSVGFPKRPYFFSDQPITCFDFEVQIGAFAGAIPIDMASWRGCEGATLPKACSLRPEGYVVVANENVEISDSNGLTCGLAAELAQYVLSTRSNSVKNPPR